MPSPIPYHHHIHYNTTMMIVHLHLDYDYDESRCCKVEPHCCKTRQSGRQAAPKRAWCDPAIVCTHFLQGDLPSRRPLQVPENCSQRKAPSALALKDVVVVVVVAFGWIRVAEVCDDGR